MADLAEHRSYLGKLVTASEKDFAGLDFGREWKNIHSTRLKNEKFYQQKVRASKVDGKKFEYPEETLPEEVGKYKCLASSWVDKTGRDGHKLHELQSLMRQLEHFSSLPRRTVKAANGDPSGTGPLTQGGAPSGTTMFGPTSGASDSSSMPTVDDAMANSLVSNFGLPQKAPMRDPQRESSRSNDNYPDAFKSYNNFYQRIVLFDDIVTSDLPIFTVMKMKYMEELDTTIDVISFDSHFLDRVPYQGAVRSVTYKEKKKHIGQALYSLGQVMSRMMRDTGEGQFRWMMGGRQISSGAAQTMALGATVAVLAAASLRSKHLTTKDISGESKPLQDRLSAAVNLFDCIRTRKNPLRDMGEGMLADLQTVNPELTERDVTLIIPQNVRRFEAKMEQHNNYQQTGTKVDPGNAHVYSILGGMKVIESRSYRSVVSGNIDPFFHRVHIGTFYDIAAVCEENESAGDKNKDFQTSSLDIGVYMSHNKKWNLIRYRDAFLNSGLFEADGALGAVGRMLFAKAIDNVPYFQRWWPRLLSDGNITAQSGSIASVFVPAMLKGVRQQAETLSAAAAKFQNSNVVTCANLGELYPDNEEAAIRKEPTCYYNPDMARQGKAMRAVMKNCLRARQVTAGNQLMLPTAARTVASEDNIWALPLTKKTFEWLLTNNIPTFIPFLIFKPRIRVKVCRSAMVAKDAGYVYVGKQAYQVFLPGPNDDNYRSKYEIHFHAELLHPERVVVQAAVLMERVEGGDDDHFVDILSVARNRHRPGVRSGPGRDEKGPSMYAIARPIGAPKASEVYMDISGAFHLQQAPDVGYDHYETAVLYRTLLGWRANNSGGGFQVDNDRVGNSIVCQGLQFRRVSPGRHEFMKTHDNHGHLRKVYPGFEADREDPSSAIVDKAPYSNPVYRPIIM